MFADGGSIKQLAYDEVDEIQPFWLPNGKKFYFTLVEDESDIWLLELNTEQVFDT